MLLVSVSSHGSSEAGQPHTLTCTVTDEEDITETPVVTWVGPEGQNLSSGRDITLGSPIVVGMTTTLTITFNPLRVSHGGEYTCQATIADAGSTASEPHMLEVIGECSYTIHFLSITIP